ncbi:hypothetical protein IWZ00DRAFT_274669 [Phyllosticta capitalensis]
MSLSSIRLTTPLLALALPHSHTSPAPRPTSPASNISALPGRPHHLALQKRYRRSRSLRSTPLLSCHRTISLLEVPVSAACLRLRCACPCCQIFTSHLSILSCPCPIDTPRDQKQTTFLRSIIDTGRHFCHSGRPGIARLFSGASLVLGIFDFIFFLRLFSAPCMAPAQAVHNAGPCAFDGPGRPHAGCSLPAAPWKPSHPFPLAHLSAHPHFHLRISLPLSSLANSFWPLA